MMGLVGSGAGPSGGINDADLSGSDTIDTTGRGLDSVRSTPSKSLVPQVVANNPSTAGAPYSYRVFQDFLRVGSDVLRETDQVVTQGWPLPRVTGQSRNHQGYQLDRSVTLEAKAKAGGISLPSSPS